MPYTEDGTPYARGSDTSHEAAESVDASTLRGIVLGAIRKYQHYGLTCDEVEQLMQLRHQTASARINELHSKFFAIVDSGQRRLTRSRRKAVVWVAREFAPPVTPPVIP